MVEVCNREELWVQQQQVLPFQLLIHLFLVLLGQCDTELWNGVSSAKLEYPVVHAKTFTGDATQFTASLFQGLISSSAQVASHISGAFSTGIGHVFNTGDNRQGSSGGVKCSFQAGGVGTGTWKASKSVIMNASIVAMFGSIIPAPLAIPARVKVLLWY